MSADASASDYVQGFRALAQLVRREFPARRSLAEIAELWGDGIPADWIAALRRLESSWPEPGDRLGDQAL